eukprot:TRINITY_DN121554_c0_g1_i1.p1 TRINITY_DN121554_c0_g1~~TRINITY_DN121554_c0_g1_i1.p1  ORF type:complete len:393 (+),score=25.16 TRINITY_DN121554_c0_g1_i1:49-1179(+)
MADAQALQLDGEQSGGYSAEFCRAWAFLRNAQRAFAGLALDLLRSGLAFRNFATSMEKFVFVFGSLFVQLFAYSYMLTVFGPLLRFSMMFPIYIAFRKQGTPLLQALSIASQPAALMAYEASQRTSAVYSGGRERGGQKTFHIALLTNVFAFYKAELGTAKEMELVSEVNFDEEWEKAKGTGGCCCGLCCRPCCRWRSRWLAERLAVKVRSFVDGHGDGRHAFLLAFTCRIFIGAIQFPCLWWVGHMAPTRLMILVRLKVMTAFFDMTFYIVNLRAGTFAWNDLESSWTWHLKFLLAIISLKNLRRIPWIAKRWDWKRLGVLSEAPWPLDNCFFHWVTAYKDSFSWDSSHTMWDLLPACGAGAGSEDPMLTTLAVT